MALEQIWGKLLNGAQVLFEGELFISRASPIRWSVTFTSPQLIEGLFAADQITVELSDGRRGHAIFTQSYGGPMDLVFTLDGSETLT